MRSWTGDDSRWWNETRANRAIHALRPYGYAVQGVCNVTDLLADLMFACRAKGYDFGKALRAARKQLARDERKQP